MVITIILPSKTHPLAVRKYRHIYNLFSGALILFTLSLIYPLKFEIIEKISQYNVQYIFLLLGMSMIFLIVDAKRLMFVCLGCAAIMCSFLKKHSNYNLILPTENHQPSVSIAHYNLSNITSDPEDFFSMLNKASTELISFQEFNPFWDKLISEKLASTYPENLKITRVDPFGAAIFSKTPLIAKDTFFSGMTPTLMASVRLGDDNINIYSSYITPALDSKSNEKAQNQLTRISEMIHERKESSIVVGEFNDVYWSNNIRKFRSDNNLFNSRRNTTPASFAIPYNHIFYTSDLECTLFKEINDVNNTRIGIIGRYQLKIVDSDLSRAAYGLN